MTFRGPTPVREINAVIYTGSTRTTGVLRSIHYRLSDTFNSLDQDFVLIHDARVQPLHGSGDEMPTSWSLVRKDSMVLALLQEAQAGVELSPGQQALHVERHSIQVKLEAWPFILEGTLHLAEGVDLLQHIHDTFRQFMPVTDADVKYQPSPLLSFRAPFLLVNRRRIEVVMDLSLIGQGAKRDPEIVVAPVQDMGLSGTRAAELLAATSIFKVVEFRTLEQSCEELTRQRRISRKRANKGADVFVQNDLGDSLYVVESGMLEAIISDDRTGQELVLGQLGPGDIFGEMAILGDGHRSATIRAAEDASLMAVHEDAVQALIQRFPAASTRLLSLLLARRGGIEAAHRAFGQA